MVHADTIVARFDEGPTPTVTDRFAFTYDEPKLDTSIGGTNDILSFSYGRFFATVGSGECRC
jgi:hypothetical protein